MANCHSLFTSFNETITLPMTKKKELKKNRIALRNKIRKYFDDYYKGEIKPIFASQGSFVLGTVVNPIDGTSYDVDDGVYFRSSIEDRKPVQTYHNQILNAVNDHASDFKDKNTCIRIIYADGHHVDLPIYFMDKNNTYSIPELAHKEGWKQSDPRAFIEWFKSKKNNQLLRVIRYLKAWRDNQSSVKLPSSMILTVLATNLYIKDDRDDISFLNTVNAITSKLQYNFDCYRPTVDTNENLLVKYETNKESILNKLNKLIEKGNQAINEPNQKNACEKWQIVFGDRFSCSNAKDELEESVKFSSPAILKNNGKSACRY